MAANPLGKVLRLGVIQGGKIIEDRTLDKRENVSIGNDGKNTVVVPMSNLPKSLVVFELKGTQYSLCFTEDMDGRLSTGGGSNDQLSFAALKSQGLAKKRGDVYVMPLTESAKGKLSLGEITLLFQFVNPPKVLPKMELPKAAKGGLVNTVDRTFTGVLMFFLFIEFAGAGALSRMPLPNDDVSLEELPDRFVKMVVPEKKPEPPKPKDDGKKPEEAKKDDTPKENKKEPPKDSAQHKAEVAQKVASKGLLKVLGAQGGVGAGIADVLGNGAAATDVASALAGASGVATAQSDAVGGPKGGGAGSAAGIGDLGTQGGGAVDTGPKKEAQIRGRVMDSAPEVESSDLDKAALARFIKVRLSAIQACYEAQLKRNPQLKGKIVVRFTIGSTGRVTDVEIDENQMGNDEVASCIKAKIRAWTTPFKPDGDATVSYPFVFQPAS
ncbi:MAG: AgmX/PglI C-terminal domain-containing protein [Deltaproteobacteria bacterium]|nr:AgmX/PglI C-terminal domain-containing protein [Deltaproteobacteria bacterium]